MTGDPLPVRLRALLVPVVLFAAAVLVVVLGMQLRAARAELRLTHQRAVLPMAGQVVPPVRVRTLAGDSVLIGEGPPGSRQVLFVFNTTCGACLETLAAWGRLSDELAIGDGVSVLGWSHDSDALTRAFVSTHALRFATVAGAPRKYLRLYHIRGIPSTVVIDEDGNVVYGHVGALSPAAEDSVAVMALKPGLPEPALEASDSLLRRR